MLRCEALCKTFFDPGRGEVRAVDHLDLEASGGVLALVGANGAGKSTFLRLVAALLQATSGRLTIDGMDPAEEPEAVRKAIGFLSPNTRLYPRLSVREMITYAAGFHHLPDHTIRERIDSLVEELDLGAIIDQPCGKLSTGQAQRANMARTLVVDPPLLVLDEPTTGLDVVAAHRVVEAVRRAKRDDRLIIFCTHVLAEVEALADRLLVLDQGKAVFDGKPHECDHGAGLADAIHSLIGGNGAGA
jgi:sodium transport system ATP-binding protein